MDSDTALELVVGLSRVTADGRRSLVLLLSELYAISRRTGLAGSSCVSPPKTDGPV